MTAPFDVPPKIILGGGARKELTAQLTRLAVEGVLLVTDPGVAALGFVDELRGDMEK